MKNKCITILFVLFFVVTSGIMFSVSAIAENKNDCFTVEDCFGRIVKVPKETKRIVCLFAFSGHVTVMLGRGNDIAAVSKGLKRDILLHYICPPILDALVPKYKGAINIEELVKAKPDLAFIPGDIGQNAVEVAKLDRFKIPYLVVDYNTIEKQQFAIGMIAKALGAQKRGSLYLEYYNKCIAKVQKRTRDIIPSKRVRVFHSVLEPTRTDPKECLTTDWIKKANVMNVSAEIKPKFVDGKNYVNIEQILLWNPDVILVNEPSTHSFILNDVRWAAMKAVKNNKVFQMPIGISRWGHPGSVETPLAILWTAKTIYPERFEDIDINVETRNYYKQFFDFELTDSLLEKILNGLKMREKKHFNKRN